MDDARFVQLYPDTPNAELARMIGCSLAAVQMRARRLGVSKSATYRIEKQRVNATGKTKSPETRDKIRQKAIGRPMSSEAKAKVLATKRERGTLLVGERHPSWKGGRPWERFKKPEYIAWRNAVLERDGYRCQQCGRRCKKYEKGLAAHHIRSYARHPDLRYDVANGVTWCRECHMAYHGRALKPKEPVPCACGCGTLIAPADKYGRPRRFVNFHAARGRVVSKSAKQLLREQRAGKKLTPEHRAKIAVGLRNSTRRVGRPSGAGVRSGTKRGGDSLQPRLPF